MSKTKLPRTIDLAKFTEQRGHLEGVLVLEGMDEAIGGPSEARRALAREIRTRLKWLARAALLTG